MSSLQSLQEQASKIPGPLGWILAITLAGLSWLIEVANHGFQTSWRLVHVGINGWELYLPTFSQLTPTGIAAGILAIAGAVVVALGSVSKLMIQHRKDMDEAQKESLSAQLDDIKTSLVTARKSLHEARNEAASRDARSQLEIERLHQEVIARDQRHNTETARFLELMGVLQADNDRLRQEIAGLQATSNRVDQTTRRIDEKTDMLSGDGIPAYRPTTPDPQGQSDGSSHA